MTRGADVIALTALLADDDLIDRTSALLTEHDPDAPPSLNKARLRFAAGEVRHTLHALIEALEQKP